MPMWQICAGERRYRQTTSLVCHLTAGAALNLRP
jgi:hypothetical protein